LPNFSSLCADGWATLAGGRTATPIAAPPTALVKLRLVKSVDMFTSVH
jgi:hypothetical protein